MKVYKTCKDSKPMEVTKTQPTFKEAVGQVFVAETSNGEQVLLVVKDNNGYYAAVDLQTGMAMTVQSSTRVPDNWQRMPDAAFVLSKK